MTMSSTNKNESYRNKIYAILKTGVKVSDIEAEKYQDYIDYSVFLGILQINHEGKMVISDEISGKNYTLSEIYSLGYYNTYKEEDQKSLDVKPYSSEGKKTKDIIYFMREYPRVFFRITNNYKFVGYIEGYRSSNMLKNIIIKDVDKLFKMLNLTHESTDAYYKCTFGKDLILNIRKMFLNGETLNNIEVIDLISGLKPYFRCIHKRTIDQGNIYSLDITEVKFDIKEFDVTLKDLQIIEEKYFTAPEINKHIDDGGVCIFGLEGSGAYSGKGIPELFPDGKRYGAKIVVTKGLDVVFVTKHASTVPSILYNKDANPEKMEKKHVAILNDGVYFFKSKKHLGVYPALGVYLNEVDSSYYKLPCIRNDHDNKGIPIEVGYTDEASGINIHTAPNDTGQLYSLGCQLIRAEDYIKFLFKTGCVSTDDAMAEELKGKPIESSIVFKGENAYQIGDEPRTMDKYGNTYTREKDGMKDSKGNSWWYIELLGKMNMKNVSGYYILDRSQMKYEYKEKFQLHKEPIKNPYSR